MSTAPPLVVGNAVQVRLLWSVDTELGINVLNFRASGSVAVAQPLADSVGIAIKQAFVANWAPHCASSVILQRVGVRDLRTANGPEFRDSGNPSPGTNPNTGLPKGVSVGVTIRTAKAGKSFRGRTYLPGATVSDEATNASQSDAINLAAAAFINDIHGRLQPLGLILGVLSRPAYAATTVLTIQAPGGPIVRTLSNVTAKTGEINDATLVEALTNRWEYQRRRDNGRAVGTTGLTSVTSIPLIN